MDNDNEYIIEAINEIKNGIKSSDKLYIIIINDIQKNLYDRLKQINCKLICINCKENNYDSNYITKNVYDTKEQIFNLIDNWKFEVKGILIDLNNILDKEYINDIWNIFGLNGIIFYDDTMLTIYD